MGFNVPFSTWCLSNILKNKKWNRRCVEGSPSPPSQIPRLFSVLLLHIPPVPSLPLPVFPFAFPLFYYSKQRLSLCFSSPIHREREEKAQGSIVISRGGLQTVSVHRSFYQKKKMLQSFTKPSMVFLKMQPKEGILYVFSPQ